MKNPAQNSQSDTKIQLPIVANTLCNEAMNYISPILAQDDSNEAAAIYEFCALGLKQQVSQEQTDAINNFPLEFVGIADMPIDDTYFNKLESLLEILIPRRSPLDNKKSQLLTTLHPELILAAALKVMIDIIISLEESFLEAETPPSYSEMAASLDPYIYQVHKLYTFLKSYASGIDYLTTKHGRKKGAIAGGIAKGTKTAELKEAVLEEYWAKHAQKSNAQAARDIHKSLPDSWLIDEHKAALLKDPVQRFTFWIGKAKRK